MGGGVLCSNTAHRRAGSRHDESSVRHGRRRIMDVTSELADIIGPRRAGEAIEALCIIAENLRGDHPHARMVLVFDGVSAPQWGKAIDRTRIEDEEAKPG